MNNHFDNTYTHNFIFGVKQDGRVTAYAVTLTAETFGFMFSDKPFTSKRQVRIKYRSNSKKIAFLKQNATMVIDCGTVEKFENSCGYYIAKDGHLVKENCGEYFERYLATAFGSAMNEKRNLSHRDGGDIVVNGIAYQVKYEGGAVSI